MGEAARGEASLEARGPTRALDREPPGSLFWTLLLLVLLASASVAALAHGATPQKVVETIEIAAPPERVWAVIGNFGDAGWMPGNERTESQGGLVPDMATRRRFLVGGGVIDERLVQYDAGAMSLRYIMENVDIKVLPVGNLSATLTVRASEAGARVEWKSRFYRAFPGGNPPEQFTDEVAVAAVSRQFEAGLKSLKARVEGPRQ